MNHSHASFPPPIPSPTAILSQTSLSNLSLKPLSNPPPLPQTLFGGGRGAATSPAGKRARVSFVQDKLSSSQMIFSVPSEKITVSQSEQLRANVPEGTTVSLIKNTLMNRAIKSSDEWQEAESLLKGTNLWFFIEEDIKVRPSTPPPPSFTLPPSLFTPISPLYLRARSRRSISL